MHRFILPFLLLLCSPLNAEAVSLFATSNMARAQPGLVPLSAREVALNDASASLFVGRDENGFFGDLPAHDPVFADAPLVMRGGSDVALIRALISAAESRRDGYDAVQHGARVRPDKLPTQMTLGEIYAWIKATPGQPHAIGRYQFIPATLRRVASKLKVSSRARFDAHLQDRLADVLLAEAGLHRFRAGKLRRVAFMNNLAKIWAGLPTSSGKSHYHGYAGNRASITWAKFDAEMARIDPGVVLARGEAPSP